MQMKVTSSMRYINELSANLPIVLLNRLVAPHSFKADVVYVRGGILVPQLTPLNQTKVRELQVSVVYQNSKESKKG